MEDNEINELVDWMGEEGSLYHYQQAQIIIQHLMVGHERLSIDEKVLQLKLVHSHLNHVREFQRRKEVALALAKYAVSDKDAILQIGVYFPEKPQEAEDVS